MNGKATIFPLCSSLQVRTWTTTADTDTDIDTDMHGKAHEHGQRHDDDNVN